MSTHDFSGHEQRSLPVGWQDQLEDADNVHDVIAIVRDFLASWDRHDLADLPEPCRPGKMFDANDVQSYALQLLRFDCASDSGAAQLITRMASFFSNASARLSAILARQPRSSALR